MWISAPDRIRPNPVYEEILAVREQQAHARVPLGLRLTLRLHLRRKQLVRFALFCRKTGRPLDEAAWLFSMAWTVKALSGWVMVQFRGMKDPDKQWHPVLSRKELRHWTYEAGLSHLTEAQLQQAEIAISRAPRQPIPDALQGGLLRITAAERDACRFWTVQAIDEDPMQRQQRKAAEKRERDRLYKAERDEASRLAGRRMSRRAYEARAAQRAEILQAIMAAHGKSRRTVYEWLKKGDPRAEALRDFDRAAENCTSVVADIERSSTRESPIIERPHFGNVGFGMSRPFAGPARLDRQTRSASAGVASPQGAANGSSMGLDGKSSPEATAPGSKRVAVEIPPTTEALQLSLFEVEALPEGRYLLPSDLQSFRRQRDYTLGEISRSVRIRNRSCLASFERGQRGLGRHHQRALKYFMEQRMAV